MQPTGTGVFERIRQNGSGAKQLVYDTALTDTIREQEAEPARIANRLIKQLSVVGVPYHNKLRSLHSSAIMYRQPSCGDVF